MLDIVRSQMRLLARQTIALLWQSYTSFQRKQLIVSFLKYQAFLLREQMSHKDQVRGILLVLPSFLFVSSQAYNHCLRPMGGPDCCTDFTQRVCIVLLYLHQCLNQCIVSIMQRVCVHIVGDHSN